MKILWYFDAVVGRENIFKERIGNEIVQKKLVVTVVLEY
jgi:hypothetical protein